MSSLVAYGSSGEESDQDSSKDAPPFAKKTPTVSKPTQNKGLGLPAPKKVQNDSILDDNNQDIVSTKKHSSMFSSLPPPKKETSPVIIEEDDSDIPTVKLQSIKKEVPLKQKVKISIPSLLDFKDDEDSGPRNKKIKPTPKGSGLLAILPEPRNVRPGRPMLPYVLTKRPTPKPAAPLKKSVPKPESSKPLISGYPDSEEESGDEGVDHAASTSAGIDFFSFSSHVPAEPAEINLDDLLPPTLGPSSKPPQPASAALGAARGHHSEPAQQGGWAEASGSSWQPPQDSDSSHSEPQQTEFRLTDEALQKLCGRRAKRGKDEMTNLIELHGDNMLPDPKDWMLKQMTEEQEMHGHRSSQPSSAHRRKHQITYLAFQAKEREIELKNQWSNNRQTKKQTQAKYGF